MMGGGMYGETGYGGFGAFGWFGLILNLAITIGVIVGIIWLVIYLVRQFSPGGLKSTGSSSVAEYIESPREVIQLRYARGEITRDQYVEMLEDLAYSS
jgi:putative membrane protein